jgi:hypothetical protein
MIIQGEPARIVQREWQGVVVSMDLNKFNALHMDRIDMRREVALSVIARQADMDGQFALDIKCHDSHRL